MSDLIKMSVMECSEHDERLSITLSRKDVSLRISGYDELPHLLDENGSGYKRITWEEFRALITSPVKSIS